MLKKILTLIMGLCLIIFLTSVYAFAQLEEEEAGETAVEIEEAAEETVDAGADDVLPSLDEEGVAEEDIEEAVVEDEGEEVAYVETDAEEEEYKDNYSMRGEGLTFSGLPLPNYDSDNGVGYGLRLYLHMHEDTPPYAWQLYVQYYATTLGYQYHEINLDWPYFLGTPVRIRAKAVINMTLNGNFYGIGPVVTYDLPGKATNSDLYAMEQRDSQLGITNPNWSKYYQFTLWKLPTIDVAAEYEITSFQWGSTEVKIRTGGKFIYYNCIIKSFLGRASDGSESEDPGIQRSFLEEYVGPDMEKISDGTYRILGYSGGHMFLLSGMLVWDSRDIEASPTKGSFSEITAQGSFNPDYLFFRLALVDRKFFEIFDYAGGRGNLVFAYRAAVQLAWGDVPFYEMRDILQSDGNDGVLGGLFSIRGPAANTFVDKNLMMLNTELRWNIWNSEWLAQKWGFFLVGFFDVGHVFHDCDKFLDTLRPGNTEVQKYTINGIDVIEREIEGSGLATAVGGAFRISWNVSTIVNVSFGYSLTQVESMNIAVDFGHQF